MAEAIERPVFAEGEVLAARDLNEALDASRGRDARHARQAHRWGVVTGLVLSGTASDAGFEVTLSPGVARDARGREIVVARERLLSPDEFDVSGNPEDWFPVFLVAVSERVAGEPMLGACGGAQGGRVREAHAIEFGRPDEIAGWEDQPAPDVDEGPDVTAGVLAPRVLVGFVQFDQDDKQFTAAEVRAGGIGPRYAGVRGGAVESVDGELTVHVGRTEDEALSVEVAGKAQPILALDRDGNLNIQGTLASALKGDVKVASGIATGGLRLPLPPGVREEDVRDGKVAVHVSVSPHVDGAFFVPTECVVDEQRRVRCWGLKIDLVALEVQMDSAPVDYLVLVGPRGKT